MAQVTDRNIGANPTGFDMRTELNNIIGALESDNSGSSEPLNTVAYMKWLDTSNATYYYYKERNHDNTAWVTLFRYTVATKIMEAVNNGTDLTTTLALKAPLASPTFTGTVVLPSTTSIGTITNTELSYLDGVTSSIQTQFTGKQATLVSGTNIKTINSNSILGSGDLVVYNPIASTLEAQAGTNNTNAITPLRLREGLNATGSAPIYACRAWVNFNGTGTVAIRGSGNVSTIGDNGTGNYTVNLTTAMPDVNYCANVSAKILTSWLDSGNSTASYTVSSFTLHHNEGSGGVQADSDIINVSIFR